MILTFQLAQVPNQSLSIQADGNSFDITIRETNGVMSADVSINNVIILSGSRIVAGFPIIPYRYLENGNFAITTLNGDLPYYTQFGITQNLIYASASDLEALRASA